MQLSFSRTLCLINVQEVPHSNGDAACKADASFIHPSIRALNPYSAPGIEKHRLRGRGWVGGLLRLPPTPRPSLIMMRASPGEAGGVLCLPCIPKPASESLRRWNERDLPACLSGARGLVARAPGARQTPGRFQPVGYVGQAHLPTHAAPRARAAGTAGPGGGLLLSPPAPARARGPRDWPGAAAHLCSRRGARRAPLLPNSCLRGRITAPGVFGEAGSLGDPEGEPCPWLSQITFSPTPVCPATDAEHLL